MSNLSDRSKINSPDGRTDSTIPSTHHGRGNGVKGFFLGMLFTVVLGAVGGGAYWFAQHQMSSKTAQTTSANSATPANSATNLAPVDVDQSSEPTAPAPTQANSTISSTADFKDLNLQVNHPNGSTLRLTGVAVGDGNIMLKMAVTNGYKEAIKLQDDNDATILKDDAGNVYNLVTPPDNATISVNPNTTVKGDFVFSGQLAPSATTLTLTTNSKFGGNATYSESPKFVIANIPVK